MAAAAASIALLAPGVLSGCSPSGTASPSPSATASTPTSPSTPVASPSTSPTSPSSTGAAPTTTGCAKTAATMPAGAVHRATIDVDGDGRPDTEWLSLTPTLRFGVTTASGATFSYALPTASPQARSGLVARLNDKRILSFATDGRAAYLHFIVDCAWVTPKNPQGTQYTFDMENLTGHGTGVGCEAGVVEGYEATQNSGKTTWTVKQTRINFNATGSLATNGATGTDGTSLAKTDPIVATAQTISCGAVTVTSGGVTAGD